MSLLSSINNTTTNAVNVAGSVGGIAQSVSNLAGLLGVQTGSWKASLKVASYGGVQFAVEGNVTVSGRKNTIHDYPFRDDNWVEDMGKQARKFAISCFLVEDDVILRTGGAAAQRDKLLNMCERAGAKTLVHPTLGTIEDVVCLGIEIEESTRHGKVYEIKLILIQSGKRLYPTDKTSTSDAVSAQSALTGLAALKDFVAKAASAIQSGASVVQQAISTGLGYYQMAISAVNDARRIISSVSTLFGNFGNLFSGANTGFTGTNPKSAQTTSAYFLLTTAAANRSSVIIAGAALQAACANPADSVTLGASIQNLINAVALSATNPADAVRLIGNMARYAPLGTIAPGRIGTDMATMNAALAALFRRYALAQLAVTLTTYQASSQDDANTVLASSVELFDSEITVSGDAGDDASYQSLRALRQAMIADLAARGADLSVISTFSFNSILPSLVLSNRIYRTVARESSLIQQINPIHPAFCPAEFQALAQ